MRTKSVEDVRRKENGEDEVSRERDTLVITVVSIAVSSIIISSSHCWIDCSSSCFLSIFIQIEDCLLIQFPLWFLPLWFIQSERIRWFRTVDNQKETFNEEETIERSKGRKYRNYRILSGGKEPSRAMDRSIVCCVSTVVIHSYHLVVFSFPFAVLISFLLVQYLMLRIMRFLFEIDLIFLVHFIWLYILFTLISLLAVVYVATA